MAVLGPVDAVFVFVPDLAAGIEWYGRLVGSAPVDSADQAQHPQLATFRVGAVDLVVHRADDVNRSGDQSGPVAYWSSDDLDALVTAATAAGAVAHRGPKTVFSHDRLVQLVDPWGNLLGLRQKAPAGSAAPVL